MSKKILVIEDEESVRSSLLELLSLLGYETIAAADGSEGIILAKSSAPDMIICDIMMPKLDGYGVLYELNKLPETSTIPFIFLTAKSALSDIRKGMEMGADDYLFKPFTMSELVKSIDTRFAKREQMMNNLSLETWHSGVPKKISKDSHIILMSNNHPESVKLESIVYIEALEHYCNVVTHKGKKLLVRKSMKDWESILPDDDFVRIHRSTIINLEYVIKFENWFNNTYRVYLQNHTEPFEISRRYGAKLRERIQEGS